MEPGLELVLLECMLDVVRNLAWVCNLVLVVVLLKFGLREPLVLGL